MNKKQADEREAGLDLAKGRRAAGMTAGSALQARCADEGWLAQRDKIPADTRNLTGRLLGDPIPGDERRHWRCGRRAQ